ncbi:cation-transporting P-type ATPase [Kribbella sp. CA-245084]|uniref:cation-transporting P-type ATPase n=1 Tax=Kribbella sp. CA-245084 TaxID=3239940 RepID=UPI003D8AFA0C
MSRGAQRRLEAHGPKELTRKRANSWVGELERRLIHPLALLLWFGTAVAPLSQLLVPPAFPVLVWGADELWRLRRRRARS